MEESVNRESERREEKDETKVAEVVRKKGSYTNASAHTGIARKVLTCPAGCTLFCTYLRAATCPSARSTT